MSVNHFINDHSGYLRYFGLEKNPFPLVPDTNQFFFTRQNDIILNNILHGINQRKGFLMLTGEVGLGKTTIVHMLLKQLNQQNIETAFVFNTFKRDGDFVDKLLNDFDIEHTATSLGDKIDCLHKFLLDKNNQGRNCVIFIDDAQNLSFENIEILRMISNLETATQKLVQIVLVGQPELSDMFERHDMRQFKSRIMINLKINPLTKLDLRNYLIVKSSNNHGKFKFAENAISALFKLSKGNLRCINKLLDRCLYAAINQNVSTIDKYSVILAAKDMGIISNSYFINYKYLLIGLLSTSMMVLALLDYLG